MNSPSSTGDLSHGHEKISQSAWGLGRLAADRSGASALEFALVATPFIFLLLAVMEIGLVYFANFSLENTVSYGARLVRTGQAQTQTFDAGRFKAEVCKHIAAPITCDGLKLDVRHFANFTDSQLTDPMQNGKIKTNFSYDPGEAGDIVVVRAFFEWELMSIFPKTIRLSNMTNGNRMLIATAAFRNEPFPKP